MQPSVHEYMLILENELSTKEMKEVFITTANYGFEKYLGRVYDHFFLTKKCDPDKPYITLKVRFSTVNIWHGEYTLNIHVNLELESFIFREELYIKEAAKISHKDKVINLNQQTMTDKNPVLVSTLLHTDIPGLDFKLRSLLDEAILNYTIEQAVNHVRGTPIREKLSLAKK